MDPHRATPEPASGSFSLKHYLALTLGAGCISVAPVLAVVGSGEGGVGLWDTAFWRMSLGTLFLLIVFGAKGQLKLPTKTDFTTGTGWLWFPGVALACDLALWHWSFGHTSVANATLLNNTATIWVTLYAWIVWKDKQSLHFVIGTLIALLGVTLVLGSSVDRPSSPAQGNPVFGDILATLTAFFYAAYLLSMKRHRREHSTPSLLFWTSLVCALCLLPLALWHPDPFTPTDPRQWLSLVALGVISHGCGQGLIVYGLAGVSASLGSVTLLIQPVATAALGWLVLGQPLVRWQIVGAAVVFGGLFCTMSARSRK